jgi:broad specificity phosphatase PhoE
MTDTIVGLLRHGQTDWNIDFRLQGITDIPLNETGLTQAREAASVLAGTSWDVVLSSPLSRAFDTAKIVSAELGIQDVAIEPLLLERSFGEAEGLRHEEWKEKYPDPNLVPGGESLVELRARSWQLLDALAERYQGQRVLTVSHGALIRKLVKLVSNGEFPRDGERFGNASMSTFKHNGVDWLIENYDPRTLKTSTHL